MDLDAHAIEIDVSRSLAEDIGSGDVTAALLSNKMQIEAVVVSLEPMLLCGQAWFDATMRQVDSSIRVNWLQREGAWLANPTELCRLFGPVRGILSAERTALNFLQTLSATATKTYLYAKQLKGYQTKLLDTRKTLPGLRLAQKYAVRCGGGMNHRMGLYDCYLIKENHIKACGSIVEAVEAARRAHPNLPVILEVESITELEQAFAIRPDRILLDNFSVDMIKQAVALNQTHHAALEVSGGVNDTNIGEIAALGVDFISIGALTKSISAIDLSLRVTNEL